MPRQDTPNPRDRIWALSAAEVTATERLVLLHVADHGPDEGTSVPRLAAQTSLTPRTVQRILRQLAGKGWITVVGQGARGVVCYAIALDQLPLPLTITPDTGSPLTHDHPRHRITPDTRSGVTHDHPDTRSPLRALPLVIDGTDLRTRFDGFWAIYPKKVGKEAAWSVWKKQRPSAARTAEIFAALTWQRTQEAWIREGGRYVPNPSTWLNRGQWADEPSRTPHLNDRTVALGRAAAEFLQS
jgi:hypothetical protein